MNPLLAALQVTSVSAFKDNYLWLVHSPRDAAQVIVVDPGDANAIRQALSAHGLQLNGILVTHRHKDHVGGVEELQSEFDVPLYAPDDPAIPGRWQAANPGALVEFSTLGLRFEVMAVPGHTPEHIAYVGHGALFCGDALFSAGCGYLWPGMAVEMTDSLAKLAALPDDTQVYCAHEYTVANLHFAMRVEPDNADSRAHLAHCITRRSGALPTVPSNLALERRINPFLRLSVQSVKQAAEAWSGRKLHNDHEVFAALREWKNGFQ